MVYGDVKMFVLVFGAFNIEIRWCRYTEVKWISLEFKIEYFIGLKY